MFDDTPKTWYMFIVFGIGSAGLFTILLNLL